MMGKINYALIVNLDNLNELKKNKSFNQTLERGVYQWKYSQKLQ